MSVVVAARECRSKSCTWNPIEVNFPITANHIGARVGLELFFNSGAVDQAERPRVGKSED
jgi:hypothetical protein